MKQQNDKSIRKNDTAHGAQSKGDENETSLHKLREVFTTLARYASSGMGSPWAFLLAITLIVVWAMLGPMVNYSDTWQLVINTGTTIITFLMVFLIQNSQNRDAKAIQLKLDELIKSIETAHNDMIDIELLTDDQLSQLEERFRNAREEGNAADREEMLTESDHSNLSPEKPGSSNHQQ